MILDDDENENEISEYNPYSDMASFQNDNDEEIDVPVSNDDSQNNLNNYFEQEENNPSNIMEENIQNEESDEDNFENPSFIDYEDNEIENEEEQGIQQQESQIADNQVSLTQTQDDADDEDGKIENYYDRKISPEQAAKSSEPKQINKRFLSIIIVVVIGGVLLFTFLMPTKSKKGSNENEKKIASKVNLTNFEALANRPENETPRYSEESPSNSNTSVPDTRKTEYDENGEVVIPPVIPEQKPTYQQGKTYSTGSSSGTTVEIPDTRNDGLHSKTISGIKGLTPTQATYSTDYATQVEKNVESTQRSSNYSMPTMEEFTSSMLSSYSQAYGNQQSAYSQQNDQSGKNSFFNNERNADSVGEGEWLNLNTIWQGTMIEATLTSELNTDLPGEITARVAKNVYSSQDGRFLLIPQNSILYGTYNSSISYAQNRVQVGWHTLIRPDGYKINLGNMNASDAKGASGLKGFVNDHPLAYLKAIGLMSVFSIVNSEFQNTMGQTDNEYVQNIVANTQQITNELGEKLIDRAMNVQPTIKIKAGTKINIVANQTLTLPPCEEIPVTQKYRKY